MSFEAINPPALHDTGAYSHAIRVDGVRRLVFLSGQVARERDGSLVGRGDLARQAEKALQNLVVALRAAGASPADLVKITTFVVGLRREHVDVIHGARRSVLGPDVLPASSLIGVDRLVDEDLLIEVEGFAALGSG